MQLAGELTKISLPSLIQLLRNGELTGKVCLSQGANTAFMYVDRGRVIHVETDLVEGREGLLELFAWMTGTFSFIEANIDAVPRTLALDEPIEKIIREGVAYLEQKKYLEQLRINFRTVLRPVADPRRTVSDPIYARLDGKTALGEIISELKLSRRTYTASVYGLLAQGLATVVEPLSVSGQIELPPWVVSRLKQDNPDISQSIVEMVIWVDRIKCWMYQADADLESIVSRLAGAAPLPEDIAGIAVPFSGRQAHGQPEQKISPEEPSAEPDRASAARPPGQPSIEF